MRTGGRMVGRTFIEASGRWREMEGTAEFVSVTVLLLYDLLPPDSIGI